jgi:phage-related tail protein
MSRWLRCSIGYVTLLVFFGGNGSPALADDTAKVDAAAQQVQSGGKQIGQGTQELTKGVSNTVGEGANLSGKRLEEAGETATPPAKTTWQKMKEGATTFGTKVNSFFSRLSGE